MVLGADKLAAIPAGSRVYLDANVWIYALEGFEPFSEALKRLFERVDRSDLIAVTSELTVAEVLVKPFSSSKVALQQLYLETLQSGEGLIVVPLDRSVLIEAAKLRAGHASIKLPDAIHAATALAQHTNVFLTGDARFDTIAGINAIVLHAN